MTRDDQDVIPDDNRARLRAILMVLPAALMILCLVALLLPILIFAPLAGHAVGAVPPDAVHVSATGSPYGPALMDREITNPHIVAHLFTQLASMPAFEWRVGCTLARPDPVGYVFRFTRWGAPVTVAAPRGDGCAPRQWWISSGGHSYGRLDASGATTRAILAEAGLPPLPTD